MAHNKFLNDFARLEDIPAGLYVWEHTDPDDPVERIIIVLFENMMSRERSTLYIQTTFSRILTVDWDHVHDVTPFYARICLSLAEMVYKEVVYDRETFGLLGPFGDLENEVN